MQFFLGKKRKAPSTEKVSKAAKHAERNGIDQDTTLSDDAFVGEAIA